MLHENSEDTYLSLSMFNYSEHVLENSCRETN